MPTLAANVTEETNGLFERLLCSKEFYEFGRDNKLKILDKTLVIKLALINLAKHLPPKTEVDTYKSALFTPTYFDDYWRNVLENPGNDFDAKNGNISTGTEGESPSLSRGDSND